MTSSQDACRTEADAVEVLSARRGQICLNGVWSFVPAAAADEAAPGESKVPIRVPGSWQELHPWHGFPPVSSLLDGPGLGEAWHGFVDGDGDDDGSSVGSAWYCRTVHVPEEWAGRGVFLSLSRVSTDAVVFANGRECGTVAWPYGEVEITDAVSAGADAELRIRVLASTTGTVTGFLDPGRKNTKQARLASRGLTGDVFLSSRPRGAHVGDVHVRTSVRLGRVALDVEIADVPSAGTVRLEAVMLDEHGIAEKSFQATATVSAAPLQTVSAEWPWQGARLWDVGRPELYTLQLAVAGPGIDDEYVQRFGFREFRVEGRSLVLNETEIRLRPNVLHVEALSQELIDAWIDSNVALGFNAAEPWPWDHDERGTLHMRELWADRADRKGFLLMMPALSINNYIDIDRPRETWSERGKQERWESRLAPDLRRYRNHPSVILWITNPNWLGHGLDQHPRHVGQRRTFPDGLWQERAEVARQTEEVIRRHDPTRPVLHHAGSSVGDIYNTNCYLNMTPLQEREEWLSEWAATGDMPNLVVEFGVPFKWTFLRGRWGMQAVKSEPLMTEYCAIYLGPEAYALEGQEYRRRIRERHVSGQEYTSWQHESLIDAARAYQKLQALFVRNTFRSWRTWGMNGGMIPWDNGYGWDVYGTERERRGLPLVEESAAPWLPGTRGFYFERMPRRYRRFYHSDEMETFLAGEAYRETCGRTLCWIAGSRPAFTAKDHSFAAECPVEKQIVLINDERDAVDYEFTWRVSVDGRELATDAGKGRLSPAQILSLPFSFRAPAVPLAGRVEGTITLCARIGAHRHDDTFAFRVFGREPAPSVRAVRLHDPSGATRDMLGRLGYASEEWTTETGADGGVFMIGRGALSGDAPLPAGLQDVLRQGGTVLVMAQSPDWLRAHLGLRVCPFPARRVFPTDTNHPAMDGLDAEDLRDWTGESTLVEGYPEARQQDPAWRSPVHGFRWGNRGAVSSAPLEKPHRSGWRPLLECEFDLAYSPLMELDCLPGRIILCTLDLEDHAGVDPAAERLAHNVLRHAAARAEPAIGRAAVLVGGKAADRATLDLLGIDYDTADEIGPDAELVVVGRDAPYDAAQAQAHLDRGGRILFLPRTSDEGGLGAKLSESASCDGSLAVPAWPECRGLSASDLRWRCDHSAWLLSGGVETGADGLLGRIASGRGVALFCQIDPERFDVEEGTYFRLTRWRQTRALAQMMANLGARFRADTTADRLVARSDELYHPDYRADFNDGDDPYRYFRW